MGRLTNLTNLTLKLNNLAFKKKQWSKTWLIRKKQRVELSQTHPAIVLHRYTRVKMRQFCGRSGQLIINLASVFNHKQKLVFLLAL